MLVLSRKQGQSIKLGSDVRITVVRIDRNNVRIGIEAPDGVSIYREEILADATAFHAVLTDQASRLELAS